MTINYTTLLGLAQPVTGTEANTWGTVVNDEITALVDSAVAGTTTLSTDSDVTLSTTTGAANQARQAVLLWTASGSTTRNITAPAQSKTYIVINATGGSQSIVLRGAGPTTGVTVVAGEKCVAAWNGSDFVKIATTVADGVTTISFGSTGLTPSTASSGAVSVAGTLITSNGGTGLTSFTAGDLPYYATGTALSKLGIGTANQVLTSSGTAPQWTTASSVSVGTATNLAGGATGSVPYQSSSGTTTFLSAGTNGYVLTLAGGVPTWAASTGISTGKSIAMAMIFGG